MSLRTRLTVAYLGFFAIALVFLHLGIYLFVHYTWYSIIDNELTLSAKLLQADFEKSNTNISSYFSGDRLVLSLAQPDVEGFRSTSLIAQVYDAQQKLVVFSPNIRNPLPLDPTAFERAQQGLVSYGTLSKGNLELRVLIAPLTLHQPDTNRTVLAGVIQVAKRVNDTNAALTMLAYALAGGSLLALIAAASGGAWLTRAAFSPINAMMRTAQGIVRASDLRSRVPVPETDDELRRLTITVNELLARLEGLFDAQRRLTADVSHELRTPLTAMQGNLEVLARGAARDPELLGESLTDMRREVARLIRMTNDLLLLAQTESGIQLRNEPVELDLLLLEVLRELRPLADGVKLQLGTEDQALVLGDRDRIKQALLNLGVNALQHTRPGGSVTLGLARTAGMATLMVQDTGSGIDPSALPHIFERFYRTDQSRSRHRGGAGLGLAIVKWIAEAHAGQVQVESQPGVGSTFTLTLPLAAEPATPQAHVTEPLVPIQIP